MKKKLFLLLITIPLMMTGCAKTDSHSEYNKIIKNEISIFKKYDKNMTKAKTAEAVATSFSKLADSLAKIKTEKNEFIKKYPEFTETEEKALPSETQELLTELNILSSSVMKKHNPKMAKFMMEPAVMEAVQKTMQTMQKKIK